MDVSEGAGFSVAAGPAISPPEGHPGGRWAAMDFPLLDRGKTGPKPGGPPAQQAQSRFVVPRHPSDPTGGSPPFIVDRLDVCAGPPAERLRRPDRSPPSPQTWRGLCLPGRRQFASRSRVLGSGCARTTAGLAPAPRSHRRRQINGKRQSPTLRSAGQRGWFDQNKPANLTSVRSHPRGRRGKSVKVAGPPAQ